MLIRVIQQRIKLGSEFTISLKTGKELRGTLLEITDDYLILESEEGEEFVRESEIARYTVPRSVEAPAAEPISSTNGKAHELPPVLAAQSLAEPDPSQMPAPVVEAQPPVAVRLLSPNLQELIDTPKTYPIEVLAAVIETQARFQAEIRKGELQPYSVDFTFPLDEFHNLNYSLRDRIRSDWVGIQNQYQAASRIRELSRFNQIAERLSSFITRNPQLPQAYYNLGCIYFEINRISDALRVFSTCATRFDYPGAWFNLAVIALRRAERARAGYALQAYFRQMRPSQHIPAWYLCTGLAHEHSAYTSLLAILQLAVDDERSDDVRLIVDAIIYVLKIVERHEDALALSAYAQSRRFVNAELVSLIEALINRLHAEPLKSFTASRQEIEALANTAQPVSVAAPLAIQPALPPPVTIAKKPELARPTPTRTVSPASPTSMQTPHSVQARTTSQRAQYAQLQLKNLDEAERLYRQAIKEGDSVESSIKNLASLLRERKRTPEAVKLLSDYFPQANDKISIQNLLADMYEHAGEYISAIGELRKLLNTDSAPQQRRVNLHRRIAYCYFKLKSFDQAEAELNALLKLRPNDSIAMRSLQGLREAKRSGMYSDLDAIFTVQSQLLDFSSSISKFLEFHLERCTYQGVPEAQARSRNFSEEDMRKLNGLIEGAGRRRPSLRAQYHLSVARLAIDLRLEDEAQVRTSLQDFAADMGDASLLDQRLPDVTIAFYSESFGVSSRWNGRLRDRLSQFIMLSYASREEIATEQRRPNPEVVLESALADTRRSQAVIESLLELSIVSRQVAEELLPNIIRSPKLRQQVADICAGILNEPSTSVQSIDDLTKLWGRGRDHLRLRNQEVIDEISFLQSQTSNLDSVREQIRRVRELEPRLRGQLDRKRVKNLEEILTLIFDYGRQQQYIERERLASIIMHRINETIEEIEHNPTRFSLELFHPYLHALNGIIDEHFSQVQQAAEPRQLQVKLAIEKYNVDAGDSIECQVTISNEPGRSPASNLAITLLPSPADEYSPIQARVAVGEALQGGQSVTYLLPLRVHSKAKLAQVFSLYYRLSYTTRAGRILESEMQALPVQIGSAQEFRSFQNPYAAHAEGSAVEDPKMFFGREVLLNRLLEAISQIQKNKSFVIYGQKRTGKSSVLYHLRRRLFEEYREHRVVPIGFSIGDIANDLSDATFLYRLMQRIEDVFEVELPEYGQPALQITRPTFQEFSTSPPLMFADYMRNLQRTIDSHAAYNGGKLLLLLDEFSYIFGAILNGRLHPDFMKAWKAMLEKGYFGSVLAGQDVMQQFIDTYPNEFQVAQSERVNYLSETDASDLIVKPIQIPETGESRYRGSAVERLIELTAGSPYYIQIFCNRLVEYMNRRSATYVTDADIERIAEDLISGSNAMGSEKFDNLITPGDEGIGLVSKSDALLVLRSVAMNTRTQKYCDRANITVSPSSGLDEVLKDLEARQVLERSGTSLYRIKVGLFHRWLLTTV